MINKIGRFMKIIRIIFFSLLALSLIAGTGIFIFFETFDTDQYLLQITKKASLALGRPVSIAGAGLGFSEQGITLDAGPLTIADDLDFTRQPFIKVDRVRISLDLRSLILRREIHITNILLQSPQIHFIRSQEGRINARSIGQASRSAGDKTAVIASPSPRIIVPPAGLIAILKGQAIPERTNFTKSKELGLLKIQDASISFIDQSHGRPLDIWLSNINASLNDFSLSKPFQLSFDASLYSNDPNVHGSARVFLDLSKQSVRISDLRLHTDLSRLDIEQLKGISPGMSDNPIFRNTTGVVQFNMPNLEIGPSGVLAANGDIIITDGVIKNFNIIKTVLSHTLGIFVGMEAIDNLLNGRFKNTLGAKDTVIEKAEAKFSIHDKTVFIDDSSIKTNIFEFTAKGSLDQGLNTDMQTMLYLNGDVSAALVNELEGLKYLMDDSKRIAIDASLKGVIPHLKYKPNKDFRKKSKEFLIEEGGNFLKNFLR